MPPVFQQRETHFQEQVTALARLLGWRVAHFRPAQTSKGWRTPVSGDGVGFPDCVFAHPEHGTLIRELKTESGRLSVAQERWLTLLVGDPALGTWRPSDWTRIESELRGERR